MCVVSFSLITYLESWFQNWAGNRARSANLLTIAFGESRRLFAKQFYVKADAYFHSGYYPTIYDAHADSEEMHMAAGTGHNSEHHEEGGDFLGKPKDWLDAFSRHFYPSRHRHLGEANGHSNHEQSSSGEEREILPWLRLAADLDPERPETYIIAAFWLRSELGKVNEAEQFLREGLQTNPGNSEILLELGNIYQQNRHDPNRARNVWELALRNWPQTDAGQTDANLLPYAQILGNLATLEEQQGNYAKAIGYVQTLTQISPNKAYLQKWIGDLKSHLE